MTALHSEYKPHPLLANRHLMTVLPGFLPRRYAGEAVSGAQRRLFAIDEQTQLLAWCHFHEDKRHRATVILLHGLEGSSDSATMVGLSHKLYLRGLNVVRLNMRNCGGTMHLTPTLYNGGLSSDILAVAAELAAEDHDRVILAGVSLGGNIVLKAAAEGADRSYIVGVAAISPAIDLQMAVQAIEHPRSRIYEIWFLQSLKKKILEKSRLFPAMFDVSHLPGIRGIRHFDDVYTAPNGGYGTADNYYYRASACRVINEITVPGLIIAAEDDPLVPPEMFADDRIVNRNITVRITKYGGHAGFVQRHHEDNLCHDQFWAENRIVDFAAALQFGRQATALRKDPAS